MRHVRGVLLCLTVGVTAVLTGCTEPDAGTPITLQFCDPAAGGLTFYPTPVWAAFKDGDGDWQRMSSAGSTFSFSMRSGVGGVSYVIASADSIVWHTLYASRDELSAFPGECGAAAGNATAAITGSANSRSFVVRHGLTSGTFVSTTNGSASATVPVSPTTADLVAAEYVPNAFTAVSKMILRRKQTLNAGATILPLDFSSGEALTPDGATVGLNPGVPTFCGGSALLYQQTVEYGFTTPTQNFAMGQSPVLSTQAPTQQVPASKLAPDDLHYATWKEVTQCGADGTLRATRTGSAWLRHDFVALTLPPNLVSPQWSRVTGRPYTTCAVSFSDEGAPPSPAGYLVQSLTTRQLNVPTGDRLRIHEVVMTHAYGSASLKLEPPDLSGVSGWADTWGFSAALANSMYGTATATTLPEAWRTFARPASARAFDQFWSASASLTC